MGGERASGGGALALDLLLADRPPLLFVDGVRRCLRKARCLVAKLLSPPCSLPQPGLLPWTPGNWGRNSCLPLAIEGGSGRSPSCSAREGKASGCARLPACVRAPGGRSRPAPWRCGLAARGRWLLIPEVAKSRYRRSGFSFKARRRYAWESPQEPGRQGSGTSDRLRLGYPAVLLSTTACWIPPAGPHPAVGHRRALGLLLGPPSAWQPVHRDERA